MTVTAQGYLPVRDNTACCNDDSGGGVSHVTLREKKTDVHVYLRMRPTPEPTPLLDLRGERKNILVARLPRKEDDVAQGVVDNSKQEHTFYFDAVFPMDTPQEQVFEVVAVPVLQNFMKGALPCEHYAAATAYQQPFNTEATP